MIDLSRIEDKLLKNNYLLMLGFPKGYIPLRVVQRDMVFYMYDPIQEGQISEPVPAGAGVNGISDLGYVSPSRMASQIMSGKPFNIFENKDSNYIYQLFWGVAPSGIRIFRNQPANTGQNNLIEYQWSQSYMAFGYIDGFESPIDAPSPSSEIIIPPDMDFALGYANPLPYPVSPIFKFVANILKIEVIKEAELVAKMLEGKVPVSIKTVGGLSDYTYNPSTYYNITPIPLGTPQSRLPQYLGGVA